MCQANPIGDKHDSAALSDITSSAQDHAIKANTNAQVFVHATTSIRSTVRKDARQPCLSSIRAPAGGSEKDMGLPEGVTPWLVEKLLAIAVLVSLIRI